jgi:hypothetical protein
MKIFKLKYFYIILLLLSSCSIGNTNLLDSLSPPVILVIKSDSVIIVEGANGKRYTVNSLERVDYRTAFLSVGDTLFINSYK